MIRVALVSRGMALRAGLRALLQDNPAVEVAAEAAALGELPRLEDAPEVIVLAGGQSLLEGLPAGRWDGETPPALLLLSDEPGAAERLAAPPPRAWGVLPLDASPEEIGAAVYALAQGLIVLTPRAGGLPRPSAPADPAAETLTEREMQVLQLLAQGQANKQIAAALGISEHTVKFHVSAIFARLDAASRTEAVRLGVQRGLISL
jgi:DNA-binding NarL/FixJ family response regulator